MNFKKYAIFFILLTGVGFALFTLISGKEKQASVLDFSSLFAKNNEGASACVNYGTIEYLYYASPEDSEKKNNKFGLYVYAESKKHLELAQNLVNSNGGDWGYVLIPFNVKDRDRDKWERVFTSLHEKHLIPIIQLWDVDPEDYKDTTQEAAGFLNSMVWPIRQRYISVYNEPNDAKFWRGKIDPGNYARVLRYSIAAFKKENLDFFLLNGALNTSAGNTKDTIDSEVYMRRMNEEVPGVFNELDGWASHSYPQPNFSGSPLATGRWSVRAYETELELLKKELGVTKDLPVFITETGWAHAEGASYNASFLPVETVAQNIKSAYENVWLKDDRVVAVTPFTIIYDPPFDHFSWVTHDYIPYKHYDVVKSMKKVSGTPEKLEVGYVTSVGCN